MDRYSQKVVTLGGYPVSPLFEYIHILDFPFIWGSVDPQSRLEPRSMSGNPMQQSSDG